MMTDPTDQPRDTDQETWLKARRWVTENMRLIHWIANPYRNHMAADEDDLLQEATMAAFQALTTAEKKQAAQRFVPFFRVIFKTRCLRLASGIQTVQPANDVLLDACTLEAAPPLPEPLPIEIDAALRGLSQREREICRWILNQERPVNMHQAAEHFHLSRRHFSRLLHNILYQLADAA